MHAQSVRALNLSPGSDQGWIADPKQHQRCLAASEQVQPGRLISQLGPRLLRLTKYDTSVERILRA
jgi:hypothetical protein